MKALIRDAREGSTEARRRLVELCADELKGFVQHQMGARLRRQISGRDLCQDTFARVFQSLDSLPADADLDTFRGRLHQNARWVVADAARSMAGLRGESSAGDDWPLRVVDPQSERTVGEVTRDDEDAEVGDLIGRLNARYGEVLRLRMDGLAYRAIAERLGETEEAVRKRYQRACEKLSELIERAESKNGVGRKR